MANYDRRILVPYLRDVCSMEMLCSQLSREIEECRADIYRLDKEIRQEPYKIKDVDWLDFKPTYSEKICALVFFVIFPLAIGLFFGLLFQERWMIKLAFIFALIVGIPIISGMRRERKRAYECYNDEVEANKRRREYNKELEVQITQWKQQRQNYQRQMDFLKSKHASAIVLCKELYGVNIIPSRYRNIHVSYYLYDFFNTSRETDLEKVIQTMLLDEIIKRLDKIIVQNEKIILNQRMQLALQENTNKMITENHKDQMLKIAQMEQNQELQMDYQRMIAKNQEVTNFFLAAEYWQNSNRR